MVLLKKEEAGNQPSSKLRGVAPFSHQESPTSILLGSIDDFFITSISISVNLRGCITEGFGGNSFQHPVYSSASSLT